LLEFLLPALQLGGEGLRLLQEVFRQRVRFDRVEHDTDAFRELIQERLVRRIETLDRREFHHGLHLAFKHDRQHDDVLRRCFA
jgi:hypothetical protein